MKLSDRIRYMRLHCWDNTAYDFLDDLLKLALKYEDAERNVERKPMKELQKVVSKFYRILKKKFTGTVYIGTDGDYTFLCHKDYQPRKDEAVFKVKNKLVVSPYRWSCGKLVIIENNG